MKLLKFILLLVMGTVASFSLRAQIEETVTEEDMPVFEDHEIVEEGEVPITWPSTKDTVRWKRGNRFGYVYNKNQILIPFDYTDLPRKLAPIMVARKNGKSGVINPKNEVLIPFEYDWVYRYEHGYAVYIRKDKMKKYGMLDFDGNIILPLIYNSTGNVSKGYFFNGEEAVFTAKTYKPTHTLFFNKQGKLIFEAPYRQYAKVGDQYFRVISEDYKHGLLNTKNEAILECRYKHVFWAQDSIAGVTTDRYMYLINLNDKTVYHNDFTNYEKPDLNGNMIVSKYIEKEKYYGLMHLNGRIIYPLRKTYVNHVKGTDIYRLNGDKGILLGLFDKNGKPILNFKKMPLSIRGLRNGLFTIKLENEGWELYNADFTLFNGEKYPVLDFLKVGHKFPKHIDQEKALAKVKWEGNWYYLYENGEKVKN